MVAKNKRNKKASLKSVIGYSVFVALALFLVGFFVYTNWRIYQRRAGLAERVGDLRAQVSELEKKNKELKDNVSSFGTEDYLEKAAREQLDMKKPGEDVYVVQKEPASAESSGEAGKKMSWWEKIKSFFIK